jgi:hypothetical protein
MAIFNSYVSLPEGTTSMDSLDRKTMSPFLSGRSSEALQHGILLAKNGSINVLKKNPKCYVASKLGQSTIWLFDVI